MRHVVDLGCARGSTVVGLATHNLLNPHGYHVSTRVTRVSFVMSCHACVICNFYECVMCEHVSRVYRADQRVPFGTPQQVLDTLMTEFHANVVAPKTDSALTCVVLEGANKFDVLQLRSDIEVMKLGSPTMRPLHVGADLPIHICARLLLHLFVGHFFAFVSR